MYVYIPVAEVQKYNIETSILAFFQFNAYTVLLLACAAVRDYIGSCGDLKTRGALWSILGDNILANWFQCLLVYFKMYCINVLHARICLNAHSMSCYGQII